MLQNLPKRRGLLMNPCLALIRPRRPYMLSLSLVSQFPLGPSFCHGSLLCPGGQPAPSVPHWWDPALSAPSWRSPALSAPHWWALALSAPPWRSSALSALHGWTPALPWRSSAPAAPPWWAPVPFVLPWWAPVSSAPTWWAPVSSAPPWWATVSSAQPWWAPVLSTPPWWSPVSSVQPWWALVLSAPPWYSTLLVSSLPHGPGPLSLPRFHLRPSALLDYSVFGLSGSRSLGGGALSQIQVHGLPLTLHQRSLAHHMNSCTTLTVALHLRLLNSHHPLH